MTPRASMASMRASVCGWTPDAPCARLPSFSAIMSRVVAHGGRFADARGVRQHDVALKLSEVCGLDAHARQFAEAGIDSVDRFAAGENALDRRRARGYGGVARGIDGQRLAAPDRPPVGERRLAGTDDDGHRPLQTRACSGLKPSR